jgi:hypothetical protein
MGLHKGQGARIDMVFFSSTRRRQKSSSEAAPGARHDAPTMAIASGAACHPDFDRFMVKAGPILNEMNDYLADSL